ncbi:recombinase family protein [Mesorhizobium sp. M7A.F.Ca.US.011.01.1.1]|uniref:recombinase family protein n=1 Tax=unclassified Mesorhizobium TaxID=325217 RepID=UPI0032AF4545
MGAQTRRSLRRCLRRALEASIEDQLRLCREHSFKERWTVVGTCADAAISGASIVRRPDIQRLLSDAQSGQFEIVLAEALDRLSRDQEDWLVSSNGCASPASISSPSPRVKWTGFMWASRER